MTALPRTLLPDTAVLDAGGSLEIGGCSVADLAAELLDRDAAVELSLDTDEGGDFMEFSRAPTGELKLRLSSVDSEAVAVTVPSEVASRLSPLVLHRMATPLCITLLRRWRACCWRRTPTSTRRTRCELGEREHRANRESNAGGRRGGLGLIQK